MLALIQPHLKPSALKYSRRLPPPPRAVPPRVHRWVLQPACITGTAPSSLPAEAPSLWGASTQAEAKSKLKMRVVVLGSGWGAASMLRGLNPKAFGAEGDYELTLISPRDYFLFTPLLPGAMSGTVEESSLMAPISNLLQGKGTYVEAACVGIDTETRTLACQPAVNGRIGQGQSQFEMPYDLLLISVGSINNTFGIKGVKEHCFFLKTIEEAHSLRAHISACIEKAGLPSTSPEERKKLLSFVVVGAGATGVEVAAELHDLVAEDVARLFPQIKEDVSITLVDGLDKVLSSFHDSVSQFASNLLRREGVTLKLETTVEGVYNGIVRVKTKEGRWEDVVFGTCIWATGIAAHPLVNVLRRSLGDAQPNRRGLIVDSRLRVLGSGGSIIAFGDAALTNQAKAAAHAEALFKRGHAGPDGKLSLHELIELCKQANVEFPQLGDLALQLSSSPQAVLGRLLFPSKAAEEVVARHRAAIDAGVRFKEFKELLADADRVTHPLPPTAQVARQQGEYIAHILSRKALHLGPAQPQSPVAGAEPGGSALPRVELEPGVSPFVYIHLGSLAYLGMNNAVMQLPSFLPLSSIKGWLAVHLWRALELFMQVSARNQWLVAHDWIHAYFFGRRLLDEK